MKNLFYLLCILQLTSCATYDQHQKEALKIYTDDEETLSHRFYLIGNTALGSQPQSDQTLFSMMEKVRTDSSNPTVLFLGNQVSNLAKLNPKSTKKGIHQALKNALDKLEDCGCDAVFVPNYADWEVNGQKGLKEQEEYIDKHLGKDHFLPKKGCPLKRTYIGDDIVIIFVDAEWYITNWDNHPNLNYDCKIKTRSTFMSRLSDYVRKARGKTTLLVTSRPILSNGEYGGHFSAKSNLLPLPILGNIKNVIRKTSGFSQRDISNYRYNELKLRLTSLAQQNDKVILLSGHEKNLQYLVQNGIPQIISGASGEATPVQNSKNLRFSIGAEGYAVLDVYKDGSSEVAFYDSQNQSPIYVGNVLGKDPIDHKSYPRIEQDSIEASIFTKKEAHKDFIYRFLIGNRYRKYYGLDIKAKVAYLDTLKGGLQVLRRGGGHQSESLQLEAPDGKLYVMRAMKKNSAQYMQTVTFRNYYIQDQLKNTWSEKLVQDFFTGDYPYSILLAEGLSKPLNIPTQNSQIMYIPKQEVLGNFNVDNGDKLYVFEEHPEKGSYQLGAVPFEGKVINTYDLIENLRKDEEYALDQESYAKARLFDMLIGDWDRHRDQWKWLEYKEEGKKIYRPLPRDRDQAFSKMADGVLAQITMFLVPYSRVFNNYCGNLKAVKQFNMEPFPLDVTLMPDLTQEDWARVAQYIQTELTDEAIDEVFDNMPPELKDESLDKIKKYLKERRGNLQKIAQKYYKRLALYPKIMGTDKDDYFKIEVKPNKEVEVSVYRKKEGTIKDRFHHRVYSPHETKALWIYGLEDKDSFEVIGKGSAIKIILVGGQNNDEYMVQSRNRVHIYDFKSKKNEVEHAKHKAHLHLRDDYDTNSFDFEKAYDNNFQFLPILSMNQDVNTKVGGNFQFSSQKFKGKISHNLSVNYINATDAVIANYSGYFSQFIGRYGLSVNAQYNSDNATKNFFGWGNETINIQDSLNLNFNRVNMTGYNVAPSISRTYPSKWGLSTGFQYLNTQVNEKPERISENNNDIPDYLFKNNGFVSVNGSVFYSNSDYKAFPTNAFSTSLGLKYTKNITEGSSGFMEITPMINLETRLVNSGKIVYATKLSGKVIVGDGYEFFQGAYLGGDNGLRGFRNQRFSGKYSFSQSNDLRWVFNRFRTFILPMRLGVFGGFDYGRVWVENDTSNIWHNSYGGGLLFVFAESSTLTLGTFETDEGNQFLLNLGFTF